ncbi:MAG: FAD-dependent oxidoreductase [Anaerolineales bacterium]|nr:FAD-dependent oxidoreductase [Anaerolineales bacterium]
MIALSPAERKARLNKESRGVPLRPVATRIYDSEDVLGVMDEEWAVYEASRCIHCPDPAPCQRACPANNHISEALWLIEQRKFLEAAQVYRRTSSMPEVCGRICPQDRLCEGGCASHRRGLPVPTGALEAFVCEYERRVSEVHVPVPAPTGRKVAIVGAGPAGLACAEQLVRRGHWVTIFDTHPTPGGMMVYAIPNFKLPHRLVHELWQGLERAGVSFVGNTTIGPKKTVDSLFADGFESVFIGTGTGVDAWLDIPGSNLAGIYRATDFLLPGSMGADALADIGKRVVVIGTGDAAFDCMRTALRRGAEQVTCIFRRPEEEMLGRRRDRDMAIDEGASFQYRVAPIRFIGGADGRLAHIECARTRMVRDPKSETRHPVAIKTSRFLIDADSAIVSLGYYPDTAISATTPGLKTHKWGLLFADPETGATSRFGIFTGGDVATGPNLVVTAMVAGRKAAVTIDAYLE